jgi:4,5-DOPA dioxygenase extradiol
MNVVLDNDFTRALAAWGKRLPEPRAIMVVSAHWLTDGTFVSCTARPCTIHDFYGFPKDLYRITYPAPGAPEEARYVTGTVRRTAIGCDLTWGLDHASWAVLHHLFPGATVPVFELSLDYSFNDWHPKPVQYHYELAAELAGLRRRGVLVIGSGNIVHNLSLLAAGEIDASPPSWAEAFDKEVKGRLLSRDHGALLDVRGLGKESALAVPTLDHYLPMAYTLALQEENEPLAFTYEGFQYGSISMRCFQIG